MVGLLTGDFFLAGILVSNVSLIIAAIFLYKLVLTEDDRSTALRSVKYLFLFPTAFILSGIFTESLYLALIIMGFYYARRSKWLYVGVIGFMLALTRSIGVLFILPMLYEYLRGIGFNSKRINPDVCYLLLIPAGLFVFSLYNYYLVGDFLAFIHIQSAWGRGLSNPVLTLVQALQSSYLDAAFYAYFTLIFLLAALLFYRKIGVSYWIVLAYSLLIPLLLGINSMPRYLLVVFPLFILFARLGKDDRVDQALTIMLALLQGFLMVFWTTGFTLVI
jgi:hypothetical protein